MLCLTRRPVVRSAPTAPASGAPCSTLRLSARGPRLSARRPRLSARRRRSIRASPPGCPARGLRCVRSLHRRSRGRRSRRRLRGGQGLIAPRPCRPPRLPAARRPSPGPSPRRGRPRRRQGRLRRCRLPHRRPRPALRPPLAWGCSGAWTLGDLSAAAPRRPPVAHRLTPSPLARVRSVRFRERSLPVVGRYPLGRAPPAFAPRWLPVRARSRLGFGVGGAVRRRLSPGGRLRQVLPPSGSPRRCARGARPKPPARPEGSEACSGRGASLVRRLPSRGSGALRAALELGCSSHVRPLRSTDDAPARTSQGLLAAPPPVPRGRESPSPAPPRFVVSLSARTCFRFQCFVRQRPARRSGPSVRRRRRRRSRVAHLQARGQNEDRNS
jgi:hypothetical protein